MTNSNQPPLRSSDDDDESETQDIVMRELRNARIEQLESDLDEKVNEIEQLKETIQELKEQEEIKSAERSVSQDSRMDGTPNRDEEIEKVMSQRPPNVSQFEALDDDEALLHKLIVDGPSALTIDHNPVYPVHERARDVLLHAPSLGEIYGEGDTMHIKIPLPDAKLHIESNEGLSIKHTQMKRVFEQLEEAGSAYPRPPILHKNRAGHIELVLFDYNALYSTR
jgi:hypothetical protein